MAAGVVGVPAPRADGVGSHVPIQYRPDALGDDRVRSSLPRLVAVEIGAEHGGIGFFFLGDGGQRRQQSGERRREGESRLHTSLLGMGRDD